MYGTTDLFFFKESIFNGYFDIIFEIWKLDSRDLRYLFENCLDLEILKMDKFQDR